MELTKAQKNALFCIRRQEALRGYFHKERASKTFDSVRSNVLEKLLTLGLIDSDGPFKISFHRVTLTIAGHEALNEATKP